MLLVLLLPVLLWGLLNLFFSTAWGTGVLEERIGKRIGLECEIDSVTWSPWAGVFVRDFKILPPPESKQEKGMVTIGEIQVDLSWASLLKGEKRWERLEVRKIEAEISVEMVRAILARDEKPTVAATVLVGETQTEPKPPKILGGERVPGAEPSTDLPPIADQGNKGEKTSKPVADPLVESIPLDDFEGVIVFSDARFRLYSENVPMLAITLDDLGGEIPVWGAEREGEVEVGLFQLGERFAEKSLTIPVQWKDRSLTITEHSLKLFGLDLKLSAGVVLQGGLPVGLELELPAQQVDLSSVFLDQKSPVEVASLRSMNVVRGYLGFPSSLQGQSTTGFEGFVFHDLTDGGETKFDRGLSLIQFSAAGVIAKDIRMIGDDDAILMNGFATSGGDLAATVRIVSSPERADSHEKRVRGAGVNLTMDFQDLITPDREFRDIRVEARSGALMMDIGEGRSWVPFFPAAEAILGRENTELPNLP